MYGRLDFREPCALEFGQPTRASSTTRLAPRRDPDRAEAVQVLEHHPLRCAAGRAASARIARRRGAGLPEQQSQPPPRTGQPRAIASRPCSRRVVRIVEQDSTPSCCERAGVRVVCVARAETREHRGDGAGAMPHRCGEQGCTGALATFVVLDPRMVSHVRDPPAMRRARCAQQQLAVGHAAQVLAPALRAATSRGCVVEREHDIAKRWRWVPTGNFDRYLPTVYDRSDIPLIAMSTHPALSSALAPHLGGGGAASECTPIRRMIGAVLVTIARRMRYRQSAARSRRARSTRRLDARSRARGAGRPTAPCSAFRGDEHAVVAVVPAAAVSAHIAASRRTVVFLPVEPVPAPPECLRAPKSRWRAVF